MEFDIRERAKKFALRVVSLVKKFPKDIVGHEIGRQLIRSGTSIGANLEEADAASTRKDFSHKIAISCKEAKETKYWLEIVVESKVLNNQDDLNEAISLSKEANELTKILYTINNPKRN